MSSLTPQEKKLLLTAKKLRQLVKADVEKTAHPALMAIMQAIGPALARLGPKLMDIVKSIKPETWAQIAHNVTQMLSQAGEVASKVGSANDKKTHTLRTVAAVEKSLRNAGVSDPKKAAEQIVMASVQAVADHRKTPNAKLVQAVQMVNDAQAEIALLREFV